MDIIIPKDSGVYARNLLGRLRHLMFRARQRELDPLNISPRQLYILFLLYSIGHKTTLAELARYTDRGIATLSIQLTKMEKDGLVKKVREKPKSALLKFELTDKGLILNKSANKMKSEKAIMSILSEEECQQLISMLKKLISEAEKYK